MSTSPEIICLGRCTVDIMNLVDHFPSGDDLIRVIDSSLQGGGPIATAAAAAARLGASVAVVDCIGDDWRGDLIREQFELQHVSTRLLQVLPGKTSTQSVLLVEAGSGRRAIINAHGDTPDPQYSNGLLFALDHCRILHITGTYPETVRMAISRAKPHGVKISFDGGAGLFREEDRAILQHVDWLICARDYAEKLTGHTAPQQMLAGMAGWGAEICGITFGEEGSWFRDEQGAVFHQPAFPVEPVVDTTGCGDSFHGAFLFARLKGYSAQKAAQLAAAVAAINARTLGGRAGLPDLETTEKFINL